MKKIIIATILVCIAFSGLVFASDKPTKDECISMCKKAAAMHKEKGNDATLKVINDKNGSFVWKGTYVFAIDAKSGSVVAHPYKPGLIGKNLIGLKDITGKMFFVEYVKICKSDTGEGWVGYMWPKPGEKKPSQKNSYVYRDKDSKVAFVAGIYE